MTDDQQIIMRAVQSLFAAYGAAYVVSAICWPAWFVDTLAIKHLIYRSWLSKRLRDNTRNWFVIPLALLKLVAVGVLFYAASFAIISVVPFTWGFVNEEGGWESQRQSFQTILAIVGSLGIAWKLESNAEVLVWGPAERKARNALTDAIRTARHLSPQANQSIAKSVEDKLAPEFDERSSYGTRYAGDLRSSIASAMTR